MDKKNRYIYERSLSNNRYIFPTKIRKHIEYHGYRFVYFSSYSPELNPIEQALVFIAKSINIETFFFDTTYNKIL